MNNVNLRKRYIRNQIDKDNFKKYLMKDFNEYEMLNQIIPILEM